MNAPLSAPAPAYAAEDIIYHTCLATATVGVWDLRFRAGFNRSADSNVELHSTVPTVSTILQAPQALNCRTLHVCWSGRMLRPMLILFVITLIKRKFQKTGHLVTDFIIYQLITRTYTLNKCANGDHKFSKSPHSSCQPRSTRAATTASWSGMRSIHGRSSLLGQFCWRSSGVGVSEFSRQLQWDMECTQLNATLGDCRLRCRPSQKP